MPRFGDPSYDGPVKLASTDSILRKTVAGTRRFTTPLEAYGLLRLGLGVFNVLEYGALADTATDFGPACQAAVNDAAAANGGVILVPPAAGKYLTYSTVSITTPNIWIVGAGPSRVNAQKFASCVVAGFAGVVFDWYTPTGGAYGFTAGGMRGLHLDLNGVATRGIRIRSMNSGDWEHLSFQNPAGGGYCMEFGCVATLTAESRDPQQHLVRDIYARLTDVPTANGFLLDGVTGGGANTSFNTFEDFWIDMGSGAGIGLDLRDCDNNLFRNIRAWQPAGSGAIAVDLKGSNSSQYLTARSNRFEGISTLLPIKCRGTSSYTYASGTTGGTIGANEFFLDAENSTVYPTIEAGAGVVFANRFAPAMQTVAYAATITPDPYRGETVNVTALTGALTLNVPTVSVHKGKEMTVILPQDGTGGRVTTFAAGYKRSTTALVTTASKTNAVTFRYDGTNWIEIAISVGM